MEDLVHAIYSSAAFNHFGEKDLAALLKQSRENNTRLGLTGMLLYTAGSFFQVLEGGSETVDRMLAKITADKRHTRVTLIIREPIDQRSFGEWSMGSAAMTRSELCQIDGLNDFFGAGSCLDQLDEGRAKKLLGAFAQGRWRAKLGQTADIISKAS